MSELIIDELKEKLNKALENVEHRFTTVRAGRASPATLDSVMVEYYGVETPLKQLATIAVPEARQLLIKPFDKSTIDEIEKGIIAANLGYTPSNDGENVRITIPLLTEERRKELVKEVKDLAEDGRISVRNIRRESMDDVDKEEFSEDQKKRMENLVQDEIDKANKKIEELFKVKEEELLSI